MKRIPVSGPWITEKEIRYVTKAVTTAWYANANVFHDRFERAFSQYLGVKHAIALPSCTAAIHLGLMGLGVGPGDEVIVPDITWIATSAPISYVGATPVFADIDATTWCLSAESLQTCITPRTKAIITVNLYGSMPDYDAIRAIAAEHRLPILEDAAESIGSEYHGHKAGSLGDVSVFSFHGSKTLTTGEGGLLATNRDDIAKRVLFLRDHGRAPDAKMFWNTEVAYKYKMSSMQAALGLAQLERVGELVERKRQIFGWYEKELRGVESVTLNAEPRGTQNSYWMITAVVDAKRNKTKEQLIADFAAEGIDARPFFYPLSMLPAYDKQPQANVARGANKVAYDVSTRGVNLPSGLLLTAGDVSRVSSVLVEHL